MQNPLNTEPVITPGGIMAVVGILSGAGVAISPEFAAALRDHLPAALTMFGGIYGVVSLWVRSRVTPNAKAQQTQDDAFLAGKAVGVQQERVRQERAAA